MSAVVQELVGGAMAAADAAAAAAVAAAAVAADSAAEKATGRKQLTERKRQREMRARTRVFKAGSKSHLNRHKCSKRGTGDGSGHGPPAATAVPALRPSEAPLATTSSEGQDIEHQPGPLSRWLAC